MGDLVAAIYRAAYDPADWSPAIERIRDIFHGSKACLVREGPNLRLGDFISTATDPVFQQRMLEDRSLYASILTNTLYRQPVLVVYSDHQACGGKLRDTKIYNEWLVPQDMYGGITCKLAVNGASTWFVDVQRGRNQHAFGDNERELLAALSPHLLRAVEIGRNLRLAEALASTAEQLAVGIIVVDASLRVATLNEAAQTILARPGCPLRIFRGSLCASHAVLEAMTACVAGACRLYAGTVPGCGGDMLARADPNDEAAADLLLSIGPLAKQTSNPDGLASIVIREISLDLPAGFERQLGDAYGFTPREAGIAALIAAGRSLKQIADRERIGVNTVRTHVSNLFRKTSTRQQSELVAHLRLLLPLTHPF